MPKIYDNIENNLINGLTETLEVSKRADCCVGYFNLRGWKEITDQIDKLSGDKVFEGKDEYHRICRLLVGMQKLPVDILRDFFRTDDDYILDQSEAIKLKKDLRRNLKNNWQ